MANSLEKKSMFKSVLEGIAAYTTSKILTQGVNLAAALIVIRTLSVFEYGVWQLVQSAGAIIGMLTLPYLENIFVTDMARDLGENNPGRYRAELLSFSKIIFPLSVITGIALFFAAGLVASWIGNDAAIPVLKIFALTFFLAPIKRVYLLFFLTKAKFALEAGFQFLNRFGYLLFVLLFISFLNYGLYGIALAYVFSVLFPLVLFFPALIRIFFESFRVTAGDYSFIQTFKAHGKWSILNDQLGVIGNLEPWIIKYFLGVEAVAIFSVALTLYSVISDLIPVEKLMRSLFPLDIADENILKFHFQQSIKYFTWLYAAMGVAAFVSMPYFISAAFPKYLPSLFLFNLFLLRFAAIPVSSVVSAALYTLRAQKYIFFINTFKIINPFVLALLVYWFGIIGIGISDIFLAYFLTFIRYKMVRRVEPGLVFYLKSLFRLDRTDFGYFKKLFSGSIA